jgi:uncharacterized metal-binding protein YceD (DUF177 family)
MKVHLRQIPAEGLHLEGEEDCLIADLGEEGIDCAGPMRYALDLGISTEALWASGTLEQPVELRCVACLEKFPYVVRVPAFVLHTELAGPETIDLAPFLREDILLNLPAYPHCDREGGRICQAPANWHAETGEARGEVWSALDRLKIKR